MAATPVRHNVPIETPGAPRKIHIDRNFTPDVTVTNLKLRFEAEKVDVLNFDEAAELEFINSLMNAPLGAFSYEGLSELFE